MENLKVPKAIVIDHFVQISKRRKPQMIAEITQIHLHTVNNVIRRGVEAGIYERTAGGSVRALRPLKPSDYQIFKNYNHSNGSRKK